MSKTKEIACAGCGAKMQADEEKINEIWASFYTCGPKDCLVNKQFKPVVPDGCIHFTIMDITISGFGIHRIRPVLKEMFNYYQQISKKE